MGKQSKRQRERKIAAENGLVPIFRMKPQDPAFQAMQAERLRQVRDNSRAGKLTRPTFAPSLKIRKRHK